MRKQQHLLCKECAMAQIPKLTIINHMVIKKIPRNAPVAHATSVAITTVKC
jgi:hypothetical protein